MAINQTVIKKTNDFASEIKTELEGFGRDMGSSMLKQLGFEKPSTEGKKPLLKGEINLVKSVDKATQKVQEGSVSMEQKMRQLHFVQENQQKELSKQKQSLQNEVEKILQEIKAEVARVQAQTAELTGEVRSITVDQVPKGIGQYHINFFEFVISSLRDIRKKVNESRMWLNLWSRKKQQRGYWQQFKKKGGLEWASSSEHALTRQNG